MATFGEGYPLFVTGSQSPAPSHDMLISDWHVLGEDGGIAILEDPGMSQDNVPLVTAVPWLGGLWQWSGWAFHAWGHGRHPGLVSNWGGWVPRRRGVSPACWVHQRYPGANKAIASGLYKGLLLWPKTHQDPVAEAVVGDVSHSCGS